MTQSEIASKLIKKFGKSFEVDERVYGWKIWRKYVTETNLEIGYDLTDDALMRGIDGERLNGGYVSVRILKDLRNFDFVSSNQ